MHKFCSGKALDMKDEAALRGRPGEPVFVSATGWELNSAHTRRVVFASPPGNGQRIGRVGPR